MDSEFYREMEYLMVDDECSTCGHSSEDHYGDEGEYCDACPGCICGGS